ncbi:MAG TPA: 16S rRNA (cytosine(1402)-N(4))-methyltransferase RsmH [Gammaproteobacteria bacterium]|nr:16S rRNA (cytosine(1402)-N(4))-methyltransferase RsmH [Gammaproteobacteria bacterium]
MKEKFNEHQSVLLKEVIENMAIKPDGVYLDATFGRGGHARAILQHLGPNGQLLAMDKDPTAIVYAHEHFSYDPRFTIQHASFRELKKFVTKQNLSGKINGILFDLGVSSPQLDDPDRGFSFMRAGKLDMRMDDSQGVDAASFLSKIDEKELADVLWKYGEERFSRRIAKAIVTARQETPITTTIQLAEIIAKAIPVWPKGKHPATRSFQAIRIAVNQELKELELGLAQAMEVLEVGGRLLVISFHSLEDRLVKHFMRHQEQGDEIPHDLPIKHMDIELRFKRLGRAVKPDDLEMAANPRARSATLRIGEKLL